MDASLIVAVVGLVVAVVAAGGTVVAAATAGKALQQSRLAEATAKRTAAAAEDQAAAAKAQLSEQIRPVIQEGTQGGNAQRGDMTSRFSDGHTIQLTHPDGVVVCVPLESEEPARFSMAVSNFGPGVADIRAAALEVREDGSVGRFPVRGFFRHLPPGRSQRLSVVIRRDHTLWRALEGAARAGGPFFFVLGYQDVRGEQRRNVAFAVRRTEGEVNSWHVFDRRTRPAA